jgi:hypothetical protein
MWSSSAGSGSVRLEQFHGGLEADAAHQFREIDRAPACLMVRRQMRRSIDVSQEEFARLSGPA